jgi:hypothetical protein
MRIVKTSLLGLVLGLGVSCTADFQPPAGYTFSPLDTQEDFVEDSRTEDVSSEFYVPIDTPLVDTEDSIDVEEIEIYETKDVAEIPEVEVKEVEDGVDSKDIYEVDTEIPCEKAMLAEDLDGDGWGAGPVYEVCKDLEGYGPIGDCDDNDKNFYPGSVPRFSPCGLNNVGICEMGEESEQCKSGGVIVPNNDCTAKMPETEDHGCGVPSQANDGICQACELDGVDDTCSGIADDTHCTFGFGFDDQGTPVGVNYMMGCVEEDDYCGEDAMPEHQVILDAFNVDRLEFTRRAYQQLMNEGAADLPSGLSVDEMTQYFAENNLDKPATLVNWYQAKGACGAVGKRLGTEAEWEAVASDKGSCDYPTGETCLDPFSPIDCAVQGNFGFVCGVGGVLPTGAKMGFWNGEVQDLGDNAEEWVEDRYHSGFYEVSTTANPLNNSLGNDRVVRGGSGSSVSDAEFTSYNRKHADPDHVSEVRGFRCFE